MTPPPPYTKLSLRVLVDDSKTLPHGYDPPIPSLRIGLSPSPDEGNSPLYIGAHRGSMSLQVYITVLICFLKHSFSIHRLTLAFRPEAV